MGNESKQNWLYWFFMYLFLFPIGCNNAEIKKNIKVNLQPSNYVLAISIIERGTDKQISRPDLQVKLRDEFDNALAGWAGYKLEDRQLEDMAYEQIFKLFREKSEGRTFLKPVAPMQLEGIRLVILIRAWIDTSELNFTKSTATFLKTMSPETIGVSIEGPYIKIYWALVLPDGEVAVLKKSEAFIKVTDELLRNKFIRRETWDIKNSARKR